MEKECACPEAAAAINSGVSATTCPTEEMIHLSRPSAPSPRDQDEDHVVQFHVNPGVTVSLQVGDSVRVVKGPMTVPMVPTAGRPSQPPIPMPVQVPVGHVVHQIMDESGQLRHVFLSAQRPHGPHEGQPPPPPQHEFYHSYYTVLPPHMPMQPAPPVWTDDRSRMQKEKMKKRLEQRHGGGPPTPPTSPTKKPPARRSKEASSPPPPAVSSSPGLQLSVCDVQQVSANLSWAAADSASVSGSEDSGVAEAPPETCTTMYQLSIGKKGKDQKIVYFGTDLIFQLDNLNPGTEYSVRLAAVPAGEGGTASGTAYASFTTQPAAPSTPSQPRLAGRTKTSLTLKWSSCPNGGSPLTAYLLEVAYTPDGEWRSLYKGREKQFVAAKLQPGKTYRFRLAAENSLGQGPFCNAIAFNTQEPPPAAPNPPRLAAPALPDRLLLAWDPVSVVNAYVLEQADDVAHGHSFYVAHHGPENQFEVRNLQPAKAYLFRLKVEANGQYSQMSVPARHVTAPAVPMPPTKLLLKGRSQPHSVRLSWAPPMHDGGAPIEAYTLQIDQGQGFQEIWSGLSCEAVIGELAPGSTYMVRLSATNVAGMSMFSEPIRVSTSAAPPGPPTWSRKQQPASATAAALRWSAPTIDGGAPVQHYEVEVADGETKRLAYQGVEPFCVVTNLQAATAHLFWVRAANAAGAGAWSAELPLTTAVAPPAAPSSHPTVEVTDDGVATFSWPPLDAATSYGLQLALVEQSPAEPQYKQEYNGEECNCQVVSLAPGSTYMARFQGMNSSGSGPFSTTVVFCTNVSVPGPVTHAPRRVSIESDGTEALLVVTFEEPTHWGGDPQGPRSFQLEAALAHSDAAPILVDTTEPTASIVLPLESSYRLRVRAVNSKGQGQASPTLKITTPPPPPNAPELRLVHAQPRALRLAWEADDEISILLEMRRLESHKFKVVYEGSEKSFKVTQLLKNTDYQFRTRAEGPGGEGAAGPVVTFRTKSAPVPFPSNLAVTEVTTDSFLVSWQAAAEHKSKVQISSSRSGPFKLLYEGPDCQFRVSDLAVDTEYWVRASLTFEGEEGAWTQPVAASVNNSAKSSPEASCRLEKAAVAPITDKRPRKRVFLKEEQKKKAMLMAAFLMSVAFAVIVARAWTM